MTNATNDFESKTGIVDRPSRSVRKIWAKRIKSGKAVPIMVYVGGSWTMHIVRGNKRVMQVPVDAPHGGPEGN